MTQDVRTLLRELDRQGGDEDRWFEDIRIGDWFFLSIQGGPDHESIPRKTAGPMDYEAFEVSVQTVHGVISYGKWGAWEKLSQKPWAARFHRESPLLMVSGNVPVAEVQQIYEDLVEFTRTHPVP
ncbi:hypothetical protein [Desulfolutivibrio sulfoxidireducens]|uniref:hypothetical protein n=1 Tax=Desulfolutivibrio sulfoxidireducens TaxID=2773299 RepID=UPI00159D36AD|nr:hypothetical protein [Desulfolutivibrio sulfoxidireducens]QLA14943.1 hypothetical protein GD605_01650 [Desulfolutivibrio sulfoxidireducens]QLA18510.1 hypothetical protein GD604_01585 [Desulfolutivibrio sulfoxidireducens]